ncbi:MAG: ribonuclease H-like domain-containing protein [Spirochaetales bacterium]|nr:ribonuclease H-like domain-containing protein [Spirochaetales bacterium]
MNLAQKLARYSPDQVKSVAAANEAQGFEVRSFTHPDLQSRLQPFLPLSLSGILELALVKEKVPLHPGEVIFLDTETTGLSRGVGTIPFLTGVAYFKENNLVIEQFFLRNPACEKEYLEHIESLLLRFPYLVSYNGKSFDMPLLANRLILHRKKKPLPVLHFDLLHILRRLYPGRVLGSYAQSRMEKEMLGMERLHDLPGAAIPQIYFDFVKYGQDDQLSAVFEHNGRDLLGLALLFLAAIQIYESKTVSHSALRSGMARILSRNHRDPEAIALLEAGPSHPDLLYRDQLLLACLHRKQGSYKEALRLFVEIQQRFACPYALLSAARLQERIFGNIQEALAATEALLRLSHERRSRLFASDTLMKRRDRLRQKLA